jgi:hypothetical protein
MSHFRCGKLVLGALCAALVHLHAQSMSASEEKPAAKNPATSMTAAETATALERVTQSNQDLIDLLKKQQAVLEDIQYDRRLQNRQISSLEERLEDAMQQNADLQAKVAKLEAEAALAPEPSLSATSNAAKLGLSPAPAPTPPVAPASYLPAPESEGEPDTKWWRRVFTLSGADGKTSDVFRIESHQWRVLWHNQDREGTAYVNTSALFINAFAKDDSVPQKVCSKLGSGGDSTELNGPGNFYLKIEASGGTWELAVEEFK